MIDIGLRDLEGQMVKAKQIAQTTQQDQVIYKSIDRLRYEIFNIVPKEGFAGNAFRTIRFAREDKHEAILQDSGNEQPDVVGEETGVTEELGRKKSKRDLA